MRLNKIINIVFLTVIFIAVSSCKTTQPENKVEFSLFRNSCETLYVTGFSNNPPISWEKDEKLYGAIQPIFNNIANKLGISSKSVFLGSDKQALEEVTDGDVDIFVGIPKRNKQKNFFFLEPKITSNPVIVILKAYDNTYIRSLDDLKQKKGVAIKGLFYGEHTQKYLKNELDIKFVKTYQELFDMIIKNEASYAIGYRNDVWAMAKKLNVRHFIRPSSYKILDENLYAAISKKSPCFKELNKINTALESMSENGEIMSQILRAGKKWDNQFMIKELK